MEPKFTGPSFTIGIEEELMILDSETLALANAIEAVLEEYGEDDNVKPELLESVLEIATAAASRTRRRRAASCAGCARDVAEAAGGADLCIGSAGTHPFAMWEDQRVSSRPRYRELIAALRFVARQEIIFGLHVHVGIDDADKAIHVANGMRVHVPILFALAANSPYWRADDTGFASTRMPIFRAFPRVGHPAVLRGLGRLRAPDRVHGRVGRDGGLHVPLVRRPPAPELRHRRGPGDGRADPRGAHARPRRADPGDGQGARRALRGGQAARPATRTRCSTRTSGWPPATGWSGELVDLPERRLVPAKELARRLYDRLREHAQDLGSAGELEAIEDLLENGNGAHRQRVVYEANHDYGEVMREIVEATRGADPCRVESRVHGERTGPLRRLQEVRLGGVAVHHRVPVLRHAAAQARAEARARRDRPGAQGRRGSARRWAG